MRTVFWEANQVRMIDQRRLPETLEIVTLRTHREVAEAIRDMVVRGAPAIGASAAFGLALAALESSALTAPDLADDLRSAAETLISARPTAVNLRWAVDRILALTPAQTGTHPAASEEISAEELRNGVVAEAQRIADEDVEINRRMAAHGAELIDDGDTIIHHCNTGALATVDWGTALGVIRAAWEQGKKIHVLVDETRPRLQGALDGMGAGPVRIPTKSSRTAHPVTS
jgi:methylthioribose-1-phosphate isomerase